MTGRFPGPTYGDVTSNAKLASSLISLDKNCASVVLEMMACFPNTDAATRLYCIANYLKYFTISPLLPRVGRHINYIKNGLNFGDCLTFFLKLGFGSIAATANNSNNDDNDDSTDDSDDSTDDSDDAANGVKSTTIPLTEAMEKNHEIEEECDLPAIPNNTIEDNLSLDENEEKKTICDELTVADLNGDTEEKTNGVVITAQTLLEFDRNNNNNNNSKNGRNDEPGGISGVNYNGNKKKGEKDQPINSALDSSFGIFQINYIHQRLLQLYLPRFGGVKKFLEKINEIRIGGLNMFHINYFGSLLTMDLSVAKDSSIYQQCNAIEFSKWDEGQRYFTCLNTLANKIYDEKKITDDEIYELFGLLAVVLDYVYHRKIYKEEI